MACALVGVALLAAGCRGKSHEGAALAPTTTEGLSTSTAPTTATVLGATLDTTTTPSPTTASTAAPPKPATTTTVPTRTAPDATVTDAPRDAHTEASDNSGTLTYSSNPAASSTTTPKANDPLEFTIACHVGSDGYGICNVDLVNHVTRTAQFPDGLKITVTMQRAGAAPLQFVLAPGNVASLRPGEEAQVEGSFILDDQGTYTYSATTTVAWP